MPIDHKNVRDVAALAKLSLTETEIQAYTQQLDLILGYVEQLNQLDTSEQEVTAHVLSLPCPQRTDELTESTGEQAAILNQAPARAQDYFLVPKIID